jgi:hypothetical protein
MNFEVKMEDFRRKTQFIAGVHTTDTPHDMTYASVVSRESVRIASTLDVLNYWISRWLTLKLPT